LGDGFLGQACTRSGGDELVGDLVLGLERVVGLRRDGSRRAREKVLLLGDRSVLALSHVRLLQRSLEQQPSVLLQQVGAVEGPVEALDLGEARALLLGDLGGAARARRRMLAGACAPRAPSTSSTTRP
jgi:hypothetical protein